MFEKGYMSPMIFEHIKFLYTLRSPLVIYKCTSHIYNLSPIHGQNENMNKRLTWVMNDLNPLHKNMGLDIEGQKNGVFLLLI